MQMVKIYYQYFQTLKIFAYVSYRSTNIYYIGNQNWKYLKIFMNLSKIPINLLLINISNIFYKITIFPKIKNDLEMFYVFENLFSVWINTRQLDFHICFCIVIWLFWLKYMKKIQPYGDMQLEKAGFPRRLKRSQVSAVPRVRPYLENSSAGDTEGNLYKVNVRMSAI